MPADLHPVRDVSTLQRGDRLDVHQFGFPAYHGVVVATMPQFKVVWIRATATGERRMLCADDYQLRRLQRPGNLG
ncbi:UNVERIFIED_CONTAM: hypothetical protein RF648_04040 [Kocuria sp. CPCC 205274]